MMIDDDDDDDDDGYRDMLSADGPSIARYNSTRN
jgi:hypothetical protein